ncbi:MAG: carbon-nitrogen hydrolase family protein [Lutibacter sp.]
MKTIKISAVQDAPIFLDIEKTIEKSCQLIIEAAKNGAKLVVFPEAFISGYPDWVWLIPNSKGAILNELYIKLLKNAISADDQYTYKLCKTAKKHDIYVVMGVNERNTQTSGAGLYNSIFFISNEGKLDGIHRKLVPTGGEKLIWNRGEGDTLDIYNTSIGKIGGLVCWENFMPSARLQLYQKGIQIHAAPTWDKSENWLTSMKAYAREGGMFIISVCQAIKLSDIPDTFSFKEFYPEGREWINTGNSAIISPNGKVLAGPISNEKKIIYADINLDEIIASKRMFDVAGNYDRPDLFHKKPNNN